MSNNAKRDYLKRTLGLRTAYEAVLTSDAAKLLAYGRNKNRRHEATVAAMRGEDISDLQIEEEDEMIHVGDVNQIILGKGGDGDEEEPVARQKPAPKTPVEKASSGLAKAAGIAALMAGTLGTGATLPGVIASLETLFSAAAQVDVTWDGQKIGPGESIDAQAEQNQTTISNP
jgi:hypothetical protein